MGCSISKSTPSLPGRSKNRERFPVDVNKADREMLLRVPGLGKRAVDKLVEARRFTTLRLADLKRLTTGLRRALPFMVAVDYQPGALTDAINLRHQLVASNQQLSLF